MSRMPPSKKLLCYFVESSLPLDPGNGKLASLIRADLERALAAGIKPHTLPNFAARRALDLPIEMCRELESIGQRHHGLSPGRVAGGLLLALARTSAEGRGATEAAARLRTEGLRPQQVTAAEAIAPHLEQGRLALVEAGTGSGKSRLIAHLAGYLLELRDAGHQFQAVPLAEEEMLAETWSPDSPAGRVVAARARRAAEGRASQPGDAKGAVLIFAPTVANVVHLVSEYEKVAPVVDPKHSWSIGVVFGRGQFASPSAVREILDAQESPDQGVAQWLEAGCPAGQSEATELLARMYPGICNLAEDLRAVATDFPVDDALLNEESPSVETDWYLALREVARSCDIVVATHAMLATDNLFLRVHRKTMLPRSIALLVDEAHRLEEAQAETASSAVSMFHLRSTLKAADWGTQKLNAAAARALVALEGAFVSLQRIPAPIKLPAARIVDVALSRAWALACSELSVLRPELQTLADMAEKREGQGRLGRSTAEVRAAGRAIEQLLSGAHGAVSFSAARRYPQLTVGPASVDALLAARWAITPAGALLSATLLYPSLRGPQAAPTIRRLALPPERTVAPVAIHPHWIRNTPLVFTPSPGCALGLVPPSADQASGSTLGSWASSVAQVIWQRVAPSAAGGTLVLMTGYERLAAVQSALAASADDLLLNRLIAQDRALLPLSQAMAEFRKQSAAGGRPIWLGLGGAWTGIDLRDERFSDADAHLDNLLTDLVIPALPFGANRSITHESRVARAGFAVEKDNALRVFLQGLGRLVRREGLLNRRIWVLDGRLLVPAHRSMVAEFVRVLEHYPMRREFEFATCAVGHSRDRLESLDA